MTVNHPITPPPELVQQWFREVSGAPVLASQIDEHIATRAAQWGADQELEACCKWLPQLPPWSGEDLRKHRRPKSPSLKEQALDCLADIEHGATPCPSDFDSIRRALEALPND
jgi:hypothetical protein